MRDRSMRSGTKFAREIQLTDWSTTGNLSNRSSGVQIPRDICTRFGRYLYSKRCSWIRNSDNHASQEYPCTTSLFRSPKLPLAEVSLRALHDGHPGGKELIL